MPNEGRLSFPVPRKPWRLPAFLILVILAGIGASAQSLLPGFDSSASGYSGQADTRPGAIAPDSEWMQGTPWLTVREKGSPAPDLNLPAFQGEERFHLASFRGSKPVVLVLGSFTCELLQDHLKKLNEFHLAHKDHAAFAFVGVAEAGHTLPGFEFLLPTNTTALQLTEEQYQERRRNLQRARELAKLQLPCFIDLPTQDACKVYAAWPSRLVVVGVDGLIARDFGSIVWHSWDWDEVAKVLKAEIVRGHSPLPAPR